MLQPMILEAQLKFQANELLRYLHVEIKAVLDSTQSIHPDTVRTLKEFDYLKTLCFDTSNNLQSILNIIKTIEE